MPRNSLLVDTRIARTLRPYQEDMIDVVGRGPGGLARHHWLIEAPTGAGKTTIAIAILADLLGDRFTHAIVIAPMTQIEDGFVTRQPMRFTRGDSPGRPIDIDARFVRAARDGNEESSCREVIEYLNAKNPGHVLATTHAVLARLAKDHDGEIREKLKGCLLVVDEAHRAPAPGLSKAVKLWDDRGGRLLYLTATPHRADGLPVKPEGMREYRRSMAEQSEGGVYSPEHFRHGIVLYGPDDVELTWKQLTGQELDGDSRVIAALAARMVQQWLEDGRPKTIVFVPPIRGGSQKSIQAVIGAFQAQGARTLDASGLGPIHQRRLLDALRAERDLMTYDESRFDVIVGGPRLPEGTDWPFCSTVYSVGVSGSMREAVQLIGRATRFKGQAGYPERHRNVATMKSFVSSATGKALEKMSVEHSRLVLVTCVFMADYQAATGFVLTRAVREALGGGASGTLGNVDGSPIHVSHGLDDATYAIVKAAMRIEMESNPQFTHGDLWNAGRKVAPDAPGRALDVIVLGMAVAGQHGEKVKAMIREKIGPEMKDIDGVLGEMVVELREVQAGAVAELEALGVQVHGMTGMIMKEFVNAIGRRERYEVDGVMYTVAELSRKFGVLPNTIWARIKIQGMTPKEAVIHNEKESINLVVHGVRYRGTKELGEAYGIPGETIRRRIKDQGLTPEEAIKKTPKTKPIKVVVDGIEYKSMNSIEKEFGISKATIYRRMEDQGITAEEAIKAESKLKPIRITVNGIEYDSMRSFSRGTGIYPKTINRYMRKHGVSRAEAIELAFLCKKQ